MDISLKCAACDVYDSRADRRGRSLAGSDTATDDRGIQFHGRRRDDDFFNRPTSNGDGSIAYMGYGTAGRRACPVNVAHPSANNTSDNGVVRDVDICSRCFCTDIFCGGDSLFGIAATDDGPVDFAGDRHMRGAQNETCSGTIGFSASDDVVVLAIAHTADLCSGFDRDMGISRHGSRAACALNQAAADQFAVVAMLSIAFQRYEGAGDGAVSSFLLPVAPDDIVTTSGFSGGDT